MDAASEEQPNLVIFEGGLKPSFVNYRNPQDDKVQLALQEADRRLRAQGKPLVKGTRADETP